MKIYPDKIQSLIETDGLKYKIVYEKAGIGRTTLYKWLKGNKIPKEENIRKLAQVLRVGVDEISDLPPEINISDKTLDDSIASLLELSGEPATNKCNDYIMSLKYITNMDNKVKNSSLIIKGIFSCLDSILYIKDLSNKYVVANKAFNDNLRLADTYDIRKKTDKDFFPLSEANDNCKEDIKVLQTGKPVIKKEKHIPGTRRKKWGIVSKYPIYDSEKQIIGLFGFFTDITDRKELEELREQLEINLDVMSEGIIIYTLDTHDYVYANKAAMEFRKAAFEELKAMGAKGRVEKYVHPDDRHLILNAIEKKQWNKPICVRTLNSKHEYRWLEYSYTSTIFMGKQCLISVNKDITDRFYQKEKITNSCELKSKKKLLAIAAKLKLKKLTIEEIAECTGLTVDEIN
jgi:PAS domain-containing protein